MPYIAIYKNERTGSYYTATDKPRSVYLPKTWWDKAIKKTAKNGRIYITAFVEEHVNDYGRTFYKLPNKKK